MANGKKRPQQNPTPSRAVAREMDPPTDAYELQLRNQLSLATQAADEAIAQANEAWMLAMQQVQVRNDAQAALDQYLMTRTLVIM